MKIFCIGRNYIDHAKELNNPVPDQPLIFMKPPTAMLRDGKPFYIPEFSNNIHYEAELVVKMSKNGKNIDPKFVESFYNELTLGIDFTARDIQKKLKEKGHPWEIAKAFDFSAVVGKWIDFPNEKKFKNISFSLQKNGKIVQKGNNKDMLFSINTIIVYLSKYFKLQIGDLIYTGTPAGVGKVDAGDILDGFIENEHLLHCEIR
jgi:2-keto-4-pentenoate hydratase/2-oxohepta-3-ene-1,7-dioic acid hydratase in catechol pathway